MKGLRAGERRGRSVSSPARAAAVSVESTQRSLVPLPFMDKVHSMQPSWEVDARHANISQQFQPRVFSGPSLSLSLSAASKMTPNQLHLRK